MTDIEFEDKTSEHDDSSDSEVSDNSPDADLIIKLFDDDTVLATCNCTNALRSGSCYVRVCFESGGNSNFVLRRPGDTHELYVRSRSPYDRYAWSKSRTPNNCRNGYSVRSGQNRRMVD